MKCTNKTFQRKQYNYFHYYFECILYASFRKLQYLIPYDSYPRKHLTTEVMVPHNNAASKMKANAYFIEACICPFPLFYSLSVYRKGIHL